MCIEIGNKNSLPQAILNKLKQTDIINQFKNIKPLIDLDRNVETNEIINEITDAVQKFGIKVYHCTKEKEKGFFERHGLIPLNPRKYVESFLKEHGHLFKNKLDEVKRRLYDFINDNDEMKRRENMVQFALDKIDSIDQSYYFHKYYGGEIIYMALTGINDDPKFGEILEKIGNPVYIEAKLDFENNPDIDFDDISKSMLNSLGFLDQESTFISGIIKTKNPIPPKNIIKVWPKEEFEEKYSELLNDTP